MFSVFADRKGNPVRHAALRAYREQLMESMPQSASRLASTSLDRIILLRHSSSHLIAATYLVAEAFFE